MEGSSAVTAVFEPVQSPTTFEETVERLGTAIKLGLLNPGTQLPPERELSQQLGISRSTLRQALTALVQSGHLHSVRGRGGGTFVADRPPLAGHPAEAISRAGWQAVLDYRVAVELGAVVLAAERATPRALDRLGALVERMAVAGRRFEAYRRADVRFHIALAEAAASARLVAAMTEVQGDMSELLARIAHPQEVLMRSNAQHAQLVAALRAGDAARAARLIRRHLEGTEHILVGLMPDEREPGGAGR